MLPVGVTHTNQGKTRTITVEVEGRIPLRTVRTWVDEHLVAIGYSTTQEPADTVVSHTITETKLIIDLFDHLESQSLEELCSRPS